jgi:hypothetical protein
MMAIIALALAQATPAPPAPAAPTAPTAPHGADVAGNWTVDLRVADGAEPYTQPMVLVIAADSRITGSFYNSPISAGRYGRNRGRSCVAFVTSDGMGDYQHAACLINGQMVGQSWAEHRQFVLPWVASR